MTHFPLPDGVEDGILNRTQLAQAFSVSENTITRWISKGMPVEEEGDNGKAYGFRLSECWSWRQEGLAEEARRKAEGDRIAAQAAQAFLNLGDDADERAGMSPAEVKEWAEAEIKWMEAAKRRGIYTLTSRVQELVEGLQTAYRSALVTLPDWAERELGLPVEDVVKLDARCKGLLEETRRRIEDAQLGKAEVAEIHKAQGKLL